MYQLFMRAMQTPNFSDNLEGYDKLCRSRERKVNTKMVWKTATFADYYIQTLY